MRFETTTIYAWTTYDDEIDDEAIIVGIGGTSASMIAAGFSYVEPTADVYWFSNVTRQGFFEAGGETGSTVPEALQRAEELRVEMGYRRVVVTIEEEGMWRRSWGALAATEGLS